MSECVNCGCDFDGKPGQQICSAECVDAMADAGIGCIPPADKNWTTGLDRETMYLAAAGGKFAAWMESLGCADALEVMHRLCEMPGDTGLLIQAQTRVGAAQTVRRRKEKAATTEPKG